MVLLPFIGYFAPSYAEASYCLYELKNINDRFKEYLELDSPARNDDILTQEEIEHGNRGLEILKDWVKVYNYCEERFGE